MMKGDPYPRSESCALGTILLVEDEVLERMAIADRLRQARYEVVEAGNAHEALEILRHSADVKLIISDIGMPGSIDGVELARLAKSEYPGIKIVLASGHLASIDWVQHDGYFRKPYDARNIIRHIKTLIG
jgi:two-component system, response regulator PdtaR